MFVGKSHLAHQQQSVEDDEKHDEVFKGRRRHQSPDVISHSDLSLRDVHFLGFDLNYVRDARFLKRERYREYCLVYNPIIKFALPDFYQCYL